MIYIVFRKLRVSITAVIVVIFLIHPATADKSLNKDSIASEVQKVRFMAVGDIMLGRNVGSRIRKHGHSWLCEYINPVLMNGDVLFGNLESPLTTRYSPSQTENVFMGDPKMAEQFAESGFNVLSVANNHILDQGVKGLEHTLEYLKKAGILAVGGGIGPREPYKAKIITQNGITIAFLGAQGIVDSGVGPQRAGIATLDIHHQVNEIKSVRKNADFIIVSLHWGNEYVHTPTKEQKEIAHKLVDAGADIIIGHHPLVLQGIERYKNGLIAYSLGNFAFDQRDPKTRESIILGIDLYKDGSCSDPMAVPLRIMDFRPFPDYGPTGEQILEDLANYSRSLGLGGVTRFGNIPMENYPPDSNENKENVNLPPGEF